MELTRHEVAFAELVADLDSYLIELNSEEKPNLKKIKDCEDLIEAVKREIPKPTTELLSDTDFDENGRFEVISGVNFSSGFQGSSSLFKEIERHQDELIKMGFNVSREFFENFGAFGVKIVISKNANTCNKNNKHEKTGSWISIIVIVFLLTYLMALFFVK